MSAGFQAVQWNRHKLVYDTALLAAVALYFALFLGAAPLLWPAPQPVTWEIQEIRAAGSCAFLMLVVILCIGPLARLNRSFLPLLYNRRHFGVLTFLVALLHVWFALSWYHSIGKLAPLVSVLASSMHWSSFAGFPFEILGLAALLILFVMAATSHDFWLSFLSPPVWKAIHMLVYAAFFLAVAHVALGVMQSESSSLVPILLGTAIVLVGALHLTAARREAVPDRGVQPIDRWLDVGPADTIPDGRARIVVPERGERIAVFRDGTKLSAVANVCAHQNGPLGEGRIIDGCITCPWHGFQFRPEDGCSPPPFTDRVPTYRLRRVGNRIEVAVEPLPLGTRTEPLEVAL